MLEDLKEKLKQMQQEGTAVRSLAGSGRRLLEQSYNSISASSSSCFRLFSYKSLQSTFWRTVDDFKTRNKELTKYCILYPSTVVGASVATVAIPAFMVSRFRTTIFASMTAAAIASLAVDIIAKDTSSKDKTDESKKTEE